MARQAMADYLTYLLGVEPLVPSGWRPGRHPLLDVRGLATERMLASARLASLEERLGDMRAAATTCANASEHGTTAGIPDTSAEAIRAILQRLNGVNRD